MIPLLGRLNLIESVEKSPFAAIRRRILATLPGLSGLYARIRFRIIDESILEAVGQFLPAQGRILDVGCGYGLFTLYFALRYPQCQFLGVELSAHRVRRATEAAERLGLRNVRFVAADLTDYVLPEDFQAAYCMDLLHHIPPAAGDRLLGAIRDRLGPEGTLIVKDITTRPRFKVYFTFLLDLLMCPRDSFYYRSVAVWADKVRALGFAPASIVPLRHYLPYPHFLLVTRKQGPASAAAAVAASKARAA